MPADIISNSRAVRAPLFCVGHTENKNETQTAAPLFALSTELAESAKVTVLLDPLSSGTRKDSGEVRCGCFGKRSPVAHQAQKIIALSLAYRFFLQLICSRAPAMYRQNTVW